MKRKQKQLTLGPHNAQFLSLVNAKDNSVRLRFLVLDERLKDTECIATCNVYSKYQIKNLFNGKSEAEMMNSHWEVTVAKNTYNELLTITKCKPKRFTVPSWFVAHQENWQGSKNGEKNSATKEQYLAERKKRDPKFQRTQDVRDMQNKGIRGELPMEKYEKLFGIDYHGLRAHIESTFQKGFTWANRGTVWTLDHIQPLTSFNLFKKDELLASIHYSNLRALEKQENIKKYNKIEEPVKKLLSMADRIEQYYAENPPDDTK